MKLIFWKICNLKICLYAFGFEQYADFLTGEYADLFRLLNSRRNDKGECLQGTQFQHLD